MAKVSVSVEVSKEAYELGMGLADFAGAVKSALADGWQVGSDVPAVITAALQHLVPAMNGANNLGSELAEDKAAFVQAWMLTAGAVYDKFKA